MQEFKDRTPGRDELLLILGIGLCHFATQTARRALAAASLLMSILIFGASLRSDWATVGLQMIYVIALFFLEHNRYSVDRTIRGEEA